MTAFSKLIAAYTLLAGLVLVFGCAATTQTSKTEKPRETSQSPAQSDEGWSAQEQQTKTAGTTVSRPPSTEGQEASAGSPQKESPTQSQKATATSATPESELARARENVRLSQETYDRVSAELENLKAAAQATPEVVQEYETYLNRVEAMLSENRKILQRMESAYDRRTPASKSQLESAGAATQESSETSIAEEGVQDEVTALDRELNESLAAFDEMLLSEMESIRASSDDKMRSLAEEAAAASRRIQEKSAGSDESSAEASGRQEAEGSDEAKETGGESQEQQDAGSGDDRRDRSEAGMTQSSSSSERRSQEASGQDDDIVARQLREAAEKETDPELKAKLWKEYEAYKKSRRE